MRNIPAEVRNAVIEIWFVYINVDDIEIRPHIFIDFP